jgi:hypothetical protein
MRASGLKRILFSVTIEILGSRRARRMHNEHEEISLCPLCFFMFFVTGYLPIVNILRLPPEKFFF